LDLSGFEQKYGQDQEGANSCRQNEERCVSGIYAEEKGGHKTQGNGQVQGLNSLNHRQNVFVATNLEENPLFSSKFVK
jgi:hypothetical protein